MRPSGRNPDQMRDLSFTRNYTMHAEGSVLVSCGNTRIICNASIEERVPRFLKGMGRGWVTAEYGMLPRSTSERMGREAAAENREDARLRYSGLLAVHYVLQSIWMHWVSARLRSIVT